MKILQRLAITCAMLFCMVAFAYAQFPDTLWTKTYSPYYSGKSVVTTADGGFITVGGTPGYMFDMVLIKTDSQGNTQWTKIYGTDTRQDYGECIRRTADGGYIVGGYLEQHGPAREYAYMLKTDSLGDTLWTKIHNFTAHEKCHSILQTTDGGYMLAGVTGSFPDVDILIIRTDSIGDTLWTKTYGGSNFEWAYGMENTADSCFVIAGYASSFGPGSQCVWILKIDSVGDTIWTQTYGRGVYDGGYDVKQLDDGGFIIGGESRVGGRSDFYLIRTDSLGDSLWTRSFGTDSSDVCYSVMDGFLGRYVMVGRTTPDSMLRPDVYALVIDGNGDSLGCFMLVTGTPDNAFCCAPTTDAGCIVSGEYNGNLCLIKLLYSPVSAFDLLFPPDSTFLTAPRPTFIWEEANTPVTYEIFIDDTARAQVADTFWLSDYDIPDGFHSWYVLADDGYGHTMQSNQIWTLCIDANGPVIESTTVWTDTSFAGPFEIFTKATDFPAGVDSVFLHYKLHYYPTWIVRSMHYTGSPGWYIDSIPVIANPNDTVLYYIRATDTLQHESTDPPGAPSNYYSFVANMMGVEETHPVPSRFSFRVNELTKRMTIFSLALPQKSHISVKVYDAAGRVVATPISGELRSGTYRIPFVPQRSGVYFYHLESEHLRKKGKLIIF